MLGKCWYINSGSHDYKFCWSGPSFQDSLSLGEIQSMELVKSQRFRATWNALTRQLPPPFDLLVTTADGDRCWNGTRRSLSVVVRCSDSEGLITVTEPSLCSYQASARAPFVCDIIQRMQKTQPLLEV